MKRFKVDLNDHDLQVSGLVWWSFFLSRRKQSIKINNINTSNSHVANNILLSNLVKLINWLKTIKWERNINYPIKANNQFAGYGSAFNLIALKVYARRSSLSQANTRTEHSAAQNGSDSDGPSKWI